LSVDCEPPMKKKKILSARIVGVTGVFGSGKTSVAKIFSKFGACVLDADRVAHEALEKTSPVYKKITALFKEVELSKSGRLDRKKIAQIIFRDSAKRKKLESIVHPYVLKRLLGNAKASRKNIVILEVPLLFEASFDRYCDKVVTVGASKEAIYKRLQEKGYSRVEVEARNKVQWPLKEKKKKSDFVVDNSGTFENTRRQAETIWKNLLRA